MSGRRGAWRVGLPGLALFGGWLICLAQAPPSACEDGYRRAGLLRDFALDRGWTIYADCAHPERPMVAVVSESARPTAIAGATESVRQIAASSETGVSRATPAAAAERPAVESGASVRLWRRDGVAAIDLAGIALGSGAAGVRIRVRVTPGGAVLRGTVRAPGSVELDAPGSGGFAGEGR